MKIVRLYYKRDVAHELDRFYIRRVPDSKTIGIAICHDDSQYDYLKSNLTDCCLLANEDRRKQIRDYRENKLSIITSPLRSATDYQPSLDIIFDYLKSDPYRVEDVLRAWCSWFIGLPTISRCIVDNSIGSNNQTTVETVDGCCTIFYCVAGPSSYYEGNDISGDFVSYQMQNDMHSCEDCNYVEYNEDSSLIYVEGSDCYVCEDCYSDSYATCHACDTNHHRDYLTYDEENDRDYCENCGLPDDSGNIHSYDYTPYLYFYDYKGGKIVKVDKPSDVNLPFYGAELEVECLGGSKGSYASDISNYGGDYEKYAYCKRDGSLSDGFEVCFMPMTFHAIKNFKFYDAVLRYRGKNSLQSYNTSTCGMHIHINREAFTDHHLFKYISFVHEFKSLIYLISQRKKVGEFNNYAKFNNSFKDRAKKSMVDSIKAKKRVLVDSNISTENKPKLHNTANFGEKYVPINLQHINTIEVRVFKGNLLEGSFRKNFEFVDALYYFTRENPIYKLKVKEFINYCTNDKKRYPNLNSFLANNTDRVQDILRFPLAVPSGLNY